MSDERRGKRKAEAKQRPSERKVESTVIPMIQVRIQKEQRAWGGGGLGGHTGLPR